MLNTMLKACAGIAITALVAKSSPPSACTKASANCTPKACARHAIYDNIIRQKKMRPFQRTSSFRSRKYN